MHPAGGRLTSIDAPVEAGPRNFTGFGVPPLGGGDSIGGMDILTRGFHPSFATPAEAGTLNLTVAWSPAFRRRGFGWRMDTLARGFHPSFATSAEAGTLNLCVSLAARSVPKRHTLSVGDC